MLVDKVSSFSLSLPPSHSSEAFAFQFLMGED